MSFEAQRNNLQPSLKNQEGNLEISVRDAISGTVGDLATNFLNRTLAEGGSIAIPSLGITLESNNSVKEISAPSTTN